MKSKRKYIFLLWLGILLISFGSFIRAYNLELGPRELQQGDRGADVAILQRILKELDLYLYRVDGLFGPLTHQAVKGFQNANNLEATGVVDEETLNLLKAESSFNPHFEYCYDNYLLLASVIEGEARGECFTGQVAVGAVIMNRVKSDVFPDNIRDVVMENGQFCVVLNGEVNYYPSPVANKAAKAALLGYDPSLGSLFFFNPVTATNREWINGRTVLINIGNHAFGL